jgi:hypothetical protein
MQTSLRSLRKLDCAAGMTAEGESVKPLSKELVIQIFPFRIHPMNQSYLPGTWPMLNCLFALMAVLMSSYCS